MKKFVSVLLALAMTLALSVSALAAGEGSITIDNAVVDKTYTIYRIFDLNSHSDDYKAINYKVSAKWSAFFEVGADGLKYVDIDNQGYVTWKKDASAPEFAAAAIAFAEAKGIANDGQKKAAGNTLTFTGLDLGYYLVKSDLGALCSLDTTMPNVTIQEKNAKPTAEKKVQENSTQEWGKTNDANIGDTVNFKTTINVVDGQPKDYILHDTMSEGLTFKTDSVVVKIGDQTLAAGTNYTVSTSNDDDCTFEVHFKDSSLKVNDIVVVTYSATVNEKAVIAGEGNPNETHLSYTNTDSTKGTTAPSETRTYTWQFDVLKYAEVTKADSSTKEEKPLSGAVFTLSRDDKGTDLITLIKVEKNVYRVAKTDETGITEITTDETGAFTIEGLDSDTYYLIEKTAPAGYNVLKAPVKVVIDKEGKVTYGDDNAVANPGVKVLNQTGTELPSTGGMGTTIFYVLGGVLMAGAFVLLVVRKRMRTE